MAPADWTWIIYLAGDNNLEGAGDDDLKEMQEVGSSDRLNVIVQFDTEVKGTTRYRVEKGSLATIEKMPGVDTGDPKVLTQFISWAINKYPARRYLVDIWNHGGGWENLPPDFNYEELKTAKPVRAARLKRLKRAVFRTTVEQILKRPAIPNGARSRAVAIDTGSHDYLDNQELKHALTKGFGPMAKADILGCDACLMNMLEIAYEVRTTTPYMVGSEQSEPNAGWPYAAIFKKLAAKPDMAPADLAKTIAVEYGAWYKQHGTQDDGSATQSALDLSKLKNVVQAVDDLARALMAELPAVAGAVSVAKTGTQKFEYPEYIDLGSFAKQLEKKLPADSKAKAPAAAVLKAVGSDGSGFVMANTTWGNAVRGATGVSIYFPQPEEYSPDYDSLELSRDGKWMPFLKAFNKAVQ
ncbi:MAG: clostripain-related cysteine peptidase [Chloroflexota bacterium]